MGFNCFEKNGALQKRKRVVTRVLPFSKMSAPGGDTFSDAEREKVEEMEDSEEEQEEMEQSDGDEEEGDGTVQPRVYIPGTEPLQPGEELEMDQTAYRLYHHCQTGAPCLSFDVIRDDLGENREESPLSMLLCAGTQAETAQANRLLVMRMHNLHGTRREEGDGEGSESESEGEGDEQEEKKPALELAMLPHYGAINRVRVTRVGDTPLAAVWSEKGQVEIFDLRPQLDAVHDSAIMATFLREQQKEATPLFTFTGHMTEGFAVDWSPKVPGRLATGDCKKHIHVWEPREGGAWHVDQRPFAGHTHSVEDIQWSPTEPTVFASCSVDTSIRIWDTRAPPSKACMLSVSQAHSSDVNVISWNRNEPFLLSGGDDGLLKVWDLRQFKAGRPVASFKLHSAPVSSVEWHPTDGSVFASAGSDDVVGQWDLSVESCDPGTEAGLPTLPPQVLFLHQGQTEVKEVHWHPQNSGVLICTALSGFNVFRTISV
ncbi:glutamate-rich WD repeat-containing protein 1-like [Acipenser ruthenus]|uniref:glutamate-rich WD repeat-containing protein 1-like n=1 Tax=Acipenser ruthenus TaxID=7906 RepID=UPI002742756E|nr:glutamate-rich WD repeat-containing protein 1-like [Acipenser ruthenus]